jgi:hypothetical protein
VYQSEGIIKLRLVYRSRSSSPLNDEVLSIFQSAILSQPYFPLRQVPFSIIFHVFAFCVLVTLQILHIAAMNTLLLKSEVEFQPAQPRVVMWLPLITNDLPTMQPPEIESRDAPGEAPEAAKTIPPKALAQEPAEEPAIASTPSKKGMSYPGPQPILSNPPDPTNSIQTILQPELEDPQVLVPLLPVPNLVQFADASTDSAMEMPQDIGPVEPPPVKPEPLPMTNPLEDLQPLERRPATSLEFSATEVPEIAPDMPPVEVAPADPADLSKMVLPSMRTNVPEPPPEEVDPGPSLEEAEAFLAERLPWRKANPDSSRQVPRLPNEESSTRIAARQQESALPDAAPLSRGTSGKKDLLALSPMPARIGLPVKIPRGEARGQFAISPEPNPDTSETGPGTKIETSSTEIGLDVKSNSSPGISGSEGIVRNVAFGSGTGSAKGSASAGAASGSGSGGSKAGSGKGTGGAKGPFAGITIAGGSYDPGMAENPNPVMPAPIPVRSNYGVAVVSTENSGGGLPYVGVFSNEQIYTVYLDMRETDSVSSHSWTFEFALIQNTTASATISFEPEKSEKGLALPSPEEKLQPVLPIELVRRHLNQLVLVYGVISVEGKMEQISVKQTPDAQLNAPLVECLSKWVFHPALIDGKPVAAKVLIGIPLRLPK